MESRREYNYHELLQCLERANESLSFYKNNKEMCMQDLRKLEMENSALAEENAYLKKRIKNAERNASLILNKSIDRLDMSHDIFQNSISFVSQKEQICDMSIRKPIPTPYENENNVSIYRKGQKNPLKASYPSSITRSTSIRPFHVGEYAFIRTIFPYNV
ncbi:hypothetical protein SteCoe_29437 [Stentor coeruleus]|uniref:Uncharacterized protein n=1 Tax=Stentor coeruleus TaxID=5963 RepID=A0A1R2B5X4_9CILI|nr:hypothetical protein SteCoe_29437 [Stentor coeruleus]